MYMHISLSLYIYIYIYIYNAGRKILADGVDFDSSGRAKVALSFLLSAPLRLLLRSLLLFCYYYVYCMYMYSTYI